MKYYAVLDTNVLVSAILKTGSVPGQIMAEALNGVIIPVLNDEIITEYEDVLNRPKFRFDKKAVKVLLDELKKRAVYSDYGLIEDEIPDSKDVIFYAVLMEKRKEEDAYLVTGNIKHFPMRTYIVTPREMLEIIGEGK
ncbi:MAG: putative toxin-antitoxin system toxin component, PIN family [Lachnospiraceae bacterium]|nr:putative toxin-antitoxin system toxin component, PIN family [Lachnospiraceae bacterium]